MTVDPSFPDPPALRELRALLRAAGHADLDCLTPRELADMATIEAVRVHARHRDAEKVSRLVREGVIDDGAARSLSPEQAADLTRVHSAIEDYRSALASPGDPYGIRRRAAHESVGPASLPVVTREEIAAVLTNVVNVALALKAENDRALAKTRGARQQDHARVAIEELAARVDGLRTPRSASSKRSLTRPTGSHSNTGDRTRG